MKLTEEQDNIIRAAPASPGDASLMVKAYAGCAKTTTLEVLAKDIKEPSAALAFNVKIKKELELRLPKNFEVLTLNGLGHRAWGRAIGKRLELDDKKLGRLVTSVAKAANMKLNGDEWDSVRRLATWAMISGLIPDKFSGVAKGLVEDTEETWKEIAFDCWVDWSPGLYDIAHEVLVQDIVEAYNGKISFDDQIYCSSMLGGLFPKYPLVMCDEAQDLSALNHRQLARCAGDRLIVVGDSLQSIYGFRGATTDSMGKIRALRPSWIELPLSTTFRCPKVVVTRASRHAHGFNAYETNTNGTITEFWNKEKEEDRQWSWRSIEVLASRIESSGHGPEIAILCRNNAPLLSMAFRLIRNGIGCVMLGRDIGKGLVVLSRKIIPDDSASADICAGLIEDWKLAQSSLAMANGHDEKVAGISDRAECLQAVLASGAKDAGGLRRMLEDLFGRDAGKVTLSTGHRAKGLEYDLVVVLDPWRIPSKWAKRASEKGDGRQLEQELNLDYVMTTRTKNTLVLANTDDFTFGEG